MKKILLFFIFIYFQSSHSQKTIHVFVALCDNINQGIVPVPEKFGNGQDPFNNLYWGALYGVKTYFKNSKDWSLVKTYAVKENKFILERILFKHKTKDVYLLADAYDGKYIQKCTEHFLDATAGDFEQEIMYNDMCLNFGGESQLICYTGHDGLMEFDIDKTYKKKDEKKRDAIILACVSKEYFKPYLKLTGANPLVWTTGLMAPEAYTLKWAIDGWILNETDLEIRERAAQAYNKYQKCGIKGARWLLVTGY